MNLKKHKTNKRNALFVITISGLIEVICGFYYLLISILTGNFEWTFERLSTTIEGVVVNLISVIALIDGIILGLCIIILIGLFIIGED